MSDSPSAGQLSFPILLVCCLNQTTSPAGGSFLKRREMRKLIGSASQSSAEDRGTFRPKCLDWLYIYLTDLSLPDDLYPWSESSISSTYPGLVYTSIITTPEKRTAEDGELEMITNVDRASFGSAGEECILYYLGTHIPASHRQRTVRRGDNL